jgi:hypothetical protein
LSRNSVLLSWAISHGFVVEICIYTPSFCGKINRFKMLLFILDSKCGGGRVRCFVASSGSKRLLADKTRYDGDQSERRMKSFVIMSLENRCSLRHDRIEISVENVECRSPARSRSVRSRPHCFRRIPRRRTIESSFS